MKKSLVLGVFLAVLSTVPAFAAELRENFDQSLELKGWSGGFYGKSGTPEWKVTPDPTAPSQPNALKQTGRATYNWLVKDGFKIRNGQVECRFRIDSGKEDPEAGIIWRFLDGQNYYYVRANIAENNIIFYRMFRGKKELVRSVDLPVEKSKWHRFVAKFHGSAVSIFFDEKEALTLKDSKIAGPGRVGLFTMADTVAAFDDFKAQGE